VLYNRPGSLTWPRPLLLHSAARTPPRQPSIYNSVSFITFRVAISASPFFSRPSALPPGVPVQGSNRSVFFTDHGTQATELDHGWFHRSPATGDGPQPFLSYSFLQFIAVIFRPDPFVSAANNEILQRLPGGGPCESQRPLRLGVILSGVRSPETLGSFPALPLNLRRSE